MLDYDCMTWIRKAERSWRWLIATAVQAGIPVPALSASLSYFDAYRSAQLPQNLTQAQRDFFGAHTYQRTDRPNAGFVHTDWAAVTDKSLRPAGGKK